MEGEGRGGHIDLGDLKTPVPAPLGKLQVGIRPTDTYVADRPLNLGDIGLTPCRVALVEYLGSAPMAVVKWERGEIRSAMYNKLREGDAARVFLKDSVKLFRDGVRA